MRVAEKKVTGVGAALDAVGNACNDFSHQVVIDERGVMGGAVESDGCTRVNSVGLSLREGGGYCGGRRGRKGYAAYQWVEREILKVTIVHG